MKTKNLMVITLAMSALLIVGIIAAIADLPSTKDAVVASRLSPEAVETNETGTLLEFISAYRDGDLVRAEFCYALPTSEDWQLANRGDDAVMLAGDKTYPLWGGNLSLPEKNTNQKGERRCSTLFFEAPADRILGKVTFRVNRLVTSLPDVYDCDLAQTEMSRSAKYDGIVIQCRLGDHTSGFDVVDKPAGMDEMEVKSMLINEVFTHSIYGPWEFETEIH